MKKDCVWIVAEKVYIEKKYFDKRTICKFKHLIVKQLAVWECVHKYTLYV